MDFIPHPSFFGIRAHLFATSSPPPKSLPNKQPAPDYFLPVGPGFATAIPSCSTSDAVTPAVRALHGVTGRAAWLPQLPHGCPLGFSLPPAITRHSYSTLALIPIQANRALAGPYLAVYIPEGSSRGTCHPSASAAGASALWGCVFQQDLLLTSHPLVCLTSSEDIQTTLGAHKLNPFRLEATTTVRLSMHARH